MSKLTHSNGKYLDISWNEAGFISVITASNGKTVNYTYDSNGNLLSAGDMEYTYSDIWSHALTAAGKTSYSWNDNGLLLGITEDSQTTSLSYGENGEVYECPIKPTKQSDKALLTMLLR